MARIKIAPTERGSEISEAMRRASNKLSPPTADMLFGDQTKTVKTNKPTGKPTQQTHRGSQDRATSEPINAKRKAASTPINKTPINGNSNGAQSSASNISNTSLPPASLGASTEVAAVVPAAITNTSTARPAKRQKVTEPTPPSRRSTRVVKPARDNTPGSTHSSPSIPPKKKAIRQVKNPVRHSTFVEDDLAAISAAPNHPRVMGFSSASTSVSDAPVAVTSRSSPSSTTPDPVPAIDPALNDVATSLPIRDAVSLPPPVDHAPYGSQLLHDQQVPQVDALGFKNVHTGQQVFATQPMVPYEPNPYATMLPEDCVIAPNNTLWIPAPGMVFSPDFSHLPALQGVNGAPIQIIPNTKGQKVKGRPKPRGPQPIAPQPGNATEGALDEISDPTSRPAANTYPRKQPFKPQIDFVGYPPHGEQIPDGYSLWDICQNYPNSLREQNLKDFVQHDWSANELCACLQDSARQILNSRKGKDKTMVFQKRLERLKKDLQAKGEYEALMAAPRTRADGRPAWVKRGNVRRK